MGPQGKREYVEAVRERYRRMNRRGKGMILKEFCAVTGWHRKHAIRVLNGASKAKAARPGPKPRYGARELEALKAIWLGAEQPCGKRLVRAVHLWLPAYERRNTLEKGVKGKLLRISAATADRLLAPARASLKGRGRCGTKPGSLLKTHIPVRGECWDESRAGFMEADTVAHCGASMAGNFLWSLTLTDIATGWTENRAVWNKGAAEVMGKVAEIERGLPFGLLGFDCDNGSEFLNHHLVAYLRGRERPVHLTRSRPYKKNDQAHVEQKNWTHVRQLLGYERLESPELVGPINELYRLWGLLQNHFCPTLKLEEKSRVGAKIRRAYGKAMTPCERALRSRQVDKATKQRLRKEMKELDPFELKAQIEAQLRRVFDLKRRLEKRSESTIQVRENELTTQVAFGNIFP